MPEGATLLDACRGAGIDTPTLCYLENLTPVNVCRVCVVEVEGSRMLVPVLLAQAEPGWWCAPTPSACAHAELVLELLASSVDLSTAPRPTCSAGWPSTAPIPRASGPRAPARGGRARRGPAGRPPRAAGSATAATVAQPVKVDNELYVRDYAKCILCYKCVEACGDGRAEHLRHRRRGARVRRPDLDRVRRAAARVRLRLLRQLHRRLPDRRADVQQRVRHARGGHWDESRADRAPRPSARTAASAATSTSTCRTTRSSR